MPKICWKSLLWVPLISIITLQAFAVNDTAIKIKWEYSGKLGPAYWGELNPDFILCKTGKQQSPIDIPTQVTKGNKKLSIHYQPSPMVIVNDGVTDLMLGQIETIINDCHGIQLNLATDQDTITFDGENYRLVQFHIHIPSENKIHGKSYPLEIHFVHQGENGTIAVIGVVAKLGKANPVVEKIIDNLPKQKDKAQAITGGHIHPGQLIPHPERYYSFMGSLTTPPCAEGIQWIVIQDSLTVSAAQIKKLQTMSGKNARPIFPINSREIMYSLN